jgi:hypothetical protein
MFDSGVNPSLKADARDVLICARRIESMRWTGRMMAFGSVAVWIAMLAVLFTGVGAMSPQGRQATWVDIVVTCLTVTAVISIPLTPIGLVIWGVGELRSRRFERQWLREVVEDDVPLQRGERLGQWVVVQNDALALEVVRQPIHARLWNPARLIGRILQSTVITSSVVTAIWAANAGGIAILSAIAIVYVAVSTMAMIEKRWRIDCSGESDAISVATSLDPVFSMPTHSYPLSDIRLILTTEDKQVLTTGSGKVLKMGGLSPRLLGRWQAHRILRAIAARRRIAT